MSDNAVVVDNIAKRFRLYRERNQSVKAALMRGRRASYEEFWALKDVSFDIPQGSTFGLIGENGSGKSTLLKCIAGILTPDRGSAHTNGSLAALLELGSGFHQELSGRENVYLNGSILGMTKKQVAAKFDEIVHFAGIEAFIDQPVKNYSSGMYMRLGFSVAINVDPDVLLVDEVLAVGDAAFQEKCMEKFLDFRRAGKTVVVVSHSMGTLRTMCDHAAWLAHGELTRWGRADQIVDDYVDQSHVEVEQVGEASEATRWGSGEARITKVELLDVDERPITRVESGLPAVVRLQFDAKEVIEKPVFGMRLENKEGVNVWSQHTRDARFEIDKIEGTGHVDLHIPRMPFQPGPLDLVVAITDYTLQHQYDFIRRSLRFEVVAHPQLESGGVASLNGRWSIHPDR